MVHELGIIEVDLLLSVHQKTIAANNKVVAPKTKVELQSLIDKINFIRKFISNLSGKIQPFSSLLKLKANKEFLWGEAQQKALEEIKQYLISPPALAPPQKHKPLYYIYLLMS